MPLPGSSRREFMAALAAAGLSLPLLSCGSGGGGDDAESNGNGDGDSGSAGKSKVYVVKASDRVDGLNRLLGMVDLGFASGRNVVLKPNFNSSNLFPASTHDDTIRAVALALKAAGSGGITLGESSGPTGTANVIAAKGTLDLCADIGVEFVNFDTLAQDERETFEFEGMGWRGGLAIPRMMRSGNAVVLLPCCKTHAFGGQFTMSLKLAVGLVPRARRMEMHGSARIRALIAEINRGFDADLVVMDAIRCFIDGGPDSGTAADPGLLLASADRVAIDAAGLAVLVSAGSGVLGNRTIFEQDQIARAVEIGLGASSPDDIELVGDDRAVLSELRSILDAG